MSAADPLFLLASLLGIATAVYWSKTGATRGVAEKFIGGGFNLSNLSNLTLMKPVLWFVIDDYGTNSRRWVDFGARNSTNINVGFINITKTRCSITQGGDFEIRDLFGRASVAEIIRANKGYVPADHLLAPPKIWRAWARSALLSVSGGLYFDGLSLCLGPSFKKHTASLSAGLFGVDYNEKQNSGVCGPYVGWSGSSGNRGWTDMAKATSALIDSGPQSWTAAITRNQIAEWNNKFLMSTMPVIREVEWTRRNDGLPIEIDDILARSQGPEWSPPTGTIYIPLDFENLERSVTYKWFMRMSSEQIMEPDSLFLWASLAKGAGSRDNLSTL